QHDQPIELRQRSRSQQHAVDDAEDGGVRPNPQRERQDGGASEARILREQADGKPKVVKHGDLDWGTRPTVDYFRGSQGYRRSQVLESADPRNSAPPADRAALPAKGAALRVFYSSLSATIGSTRAARRAGTRLAASAMEARRAPATTTRLICTRP